MGWKEGGRRGEEGEESGGGREIGEGGRGREGGRKGGREGGRERDREREREEGREGER